MNRRVKFDFEIYFTNSGSIKGEDFRHDIAEDDIASSKQYLPQELHHFILRLFSFSMYF